MSDFDTVRAGRANASVLDRISVDYYGTPTPIQQIASIASPDPRTLVITALGRQSVLKGIEKAIQDVRSGHQSPERRQVHPSGLPPADGGAP